MGAVPDPIDARDYKYSEVAGAATLSDDEWKKGYDVEKELGFTIPFKNQGGTLSCTGQSGSYYVGVLDKKETGQYNEVSAKGYYSQVFLPDGGAYIRDVIKLTIGWGGIREKIVSSYMGGNLPTEDFVRDISWKNKEIDKAAGMLKAKEYRTIDNISMDSVAMAIRDGCGCIIGLYVGNNGSWRTNDPTPSTRTGGHAIYVGKFGVDERGKYIATPNSWGERSADGLHPDRWQKLREDYFNKTFMFSPWVILDAPNETGGEDLNNPDVIKILREKEKKFVIEGTGVGRKGIIIDGKLREVSKDRESASSIYVESNNGNGVTVGTNLFDKLPRGEKF